MHFQGKALALLDWQWSKTHAPTRVPSGEPRLKPSHSDGLFEPRASWEDQLDDEIGDAGSVLVGHSDHGTGYSAVSGSANGSLGKLTQTPLGAALHQYFAQDPAPSGATADSASAKASSEVNEGGVTSTASLLSPRSPEPVFDGEKIARLACESFAGRAMFVKCLNLQRSLETRIKDRASFDTLVQCFNAFLDECVRENDIKAAKMAMILAETFYVTRHHEEESNDTTSSKAGLPSPRENGVAPNRERRESANEALLHSVENAHPALMQRGAARMYLQEEVKKHDIWKNPSVSGLMQTLP